MEPEDNKHDIRIVLHVDMDSFYASVEIRENPELKGLPVIVGSDPRGGLERGVVSTCSYEARKYGVHSAMPISRARKLCPDCVFIPMRKQYYQEVSAHVMDILRSFSERLEQVSIDEAYLVPVPEVRNFDDAVLHAHKIKEEVQKQEGITCSIGIGPNKLIAKIASGFQKPDGLTVVKPEDVKDFLFPLAVSKIPGIGKKTAEVLKLMGIAKVEELAKYDVRVLSERFGKMGVLIKQRANGIDFEEVEAREGVKSISRHVTFAGDTSDLTKIKEALDMLADDIHSILIKDRLLFKTVTILVRLEDFSTYTRAKTIPIWTSDLNVIKSTAMELFSEFDDRQLRLVGVGVTKLRKIDEKQTQIMDFQ